MIKVTEDWHNTLDKRMLFLAEKKAWRVQSKVIPNECCVTGRLTDDLHEDEHQ